MSPRDRLPLASGVLSALAAAALFGASTPFAKLLLGELPPVALAGLLYLGSGVGLSAWWLFARIRRRPAEAGLKRADLPWLAGAVASGGVVGPALLMLGLARTPASSAALLLNLEGVLTALLAWFVFKENFDRRIALGMAAISAGGVVLSWGGTPEAGVPWGPLAVAGACLAWAIDNNLTRKVSASDPVQIAAVKGLVAGVVNLAAGVAIGFPAPTLPLVVAAGAVGFVGYGASLVCFVLALRHLGTARTGAYFSLAPFVGAGLSLVVLSEGVTGSLALAAALMGLGLYLHLTERHDHVHAHEPLDHDHLHSHDEHHRHAHAPGDPPGEPHSHPHRHEAMTHAHPHYPDIHHRHGH